MEKREQSQTGCRMFRRTFGRARPLHATVETKQKFFFFLFLKILNEKKQKIELCPAKRIWCIEIKKMFLGQKKEDISYGLFLFSTFDPPISSKKKTFYTVKEKKKYLFRSRREITLVEFGQKKLKYVNKNNDIHQSSPR
jgi:hypothetical protein